MSEHQGMDVSLFVSDGLIEHLQATSPKWATKLTMERLSFVRLISDGQKRIISLEGQRDQLAAILREIVAEAVRGERCRYCDGAIGLHGDWLDTHLPGCVVVRARARIRQDRGAV